MGFGVKSAEPVERQLVKFMARYTPEVARVATNARRKLRQLLPGAVELIYDNYNALVVGFGPTERASDAILSIALYPRWVNLFFLRGVGLADPHRLLRGTGSRVRSIVLEKASLLDDEAVRDLIKAAVAANPVQLVSSGRRRVIIKSVSAKQRARRPAVSRGRPTKG